MRREKKGEKRKRKEKRKSSRIFPYRLDFVPLSAAALSPTIIIIIHRDKSNRNNRGVMQSFFFFPFFSFFFAERSDVFLYSVPKPSMKKHTSSVTLVHGVTPRHRHRPPLILSLSLSVSPSSPAFPGVSSPHADHYNFSYILISREY